MKYFTFLLFLLSYLHTSAQSSNEYMELESDDPINILLTDLKDERDYPPSDFDQWFYGSQVKYKYSKHKHVEAIEIYKKHFGSAWTYLDATFYALNSASKLDSVDWFLELYNSCPRDIQERWKYKEWNMEIIDKFNSQNHIDSIEISYQERFNKELNDQLTLIMLEDIAIRSSSGERKVPQWVQDILEKDSITYLMEQVRELPYPELAKSHWTQLDAILTENPNLDLKEVGFLANTGIEMALLHADPDKVEKHYQFIRDNFRTDLIGYYVDKALIKRKLPQIFGTQVDLDRDRKVMSFLPILDFENVDKRRMKIGQSPLAQYAKLCGINYEIEKEFHSH